MAAEATSTARASTRPRSSAAASKLRFDPDPVPASPDRAETIHASVHALDGSEVGAHQTVTYQSEGTASPTQADSSPGTPAAYAWTAPYTLPRRPVRHVPRHGRLPARTRRGVAHATAPTAPVRWTVTIAGKYNCRPHDDVLTNGHLSSNGARWRFPSDGAWPTQIQVQELGIQGDYHLDNGQTSCRSSTPLTMSGKNGEAPTSHYGWAALVPYPQDGQSRVPGADHRGVEMRRRNTWSVVPGVDSSSSRPQTARAQLLAHLRAPHGPRLHGRADQLSQLSRSGRLHGDREVHRIG